MGNINFTKKAVLDLEEIWNYTFQEWSESQADKYYDEIIQVCNKILISPNTGKDYSIITKNLKGIPVNKHIIFFRLSSNNNIEITRILHGRMDLKRKFGK